MGVKINSPDFVVDTTIDSEDIGELYVNVSVANVHSRSTFASEVVTQALMGEKVVALEKDSDWVRIRQWDGYEGWIHPFFVTEANGRYSKGWPLESPT